MGSLGCQTSRRALSQNDPEEPWKRALQLSAAEKGKKRHKPLGTSSNLPWGEKNAFLTSKPVIGWSQSMWARPTFHPRGVATPTRVATPTQLLPSYILDASQGLLRVAWSPQTDLSLGQECFPCLTGHQWLLQTTEGRCCSNTPCNIFAAHSIGLLLLALQRLRMTSSPVPFEHWECIPMVLAGHQANPCRSYPAEKSWQLWAPLGVCVASCLRTNFIPTSIPWKKGEATFPSSRWSFECSPARNWDCSRELPSASSSLKSSPFSPSS